MKSIINAINEEIENNWDKEYKATFFKKNMYAKNGAVKVTFFIKAKNLQEAIKKSKKFIIKNYTYMDTITRIEKKSLVVKRRNI